MDAGAYVFLRSFFVTPYAGVALLILKMRAFTTNRHFLLNVKFYPIS